MIRILSLGAGVQSSTVLCMSCLGVLPKLDCAIFADTQWEPKAVYRHLEWLTVFAARHGIPVYRVTAGNLRTDAIEFRRGGKSADGKRYASIPAFVRNPDGSQGIIRRQCTKEYKIIPVEKFIRRNLLKLEPRQRAPRTVCVEHWFGISWEETYRMRSADNRWEVFHYPLIQTMTKLDGLFDRGFMRQDCLDWLRYCGLPTPPRSACIGCPFHSDEEWVQIKANPEEWADVVEFDAAMRDADADAQRQGKRKLLVGAPFLHRQMVPLPQVDFGEAKAGWGNECSGVCGV